MQKDFTLLDARAFGLAAATIAGVLTTACALAIAIAPQATTAVASTLIHLDLSEMSRSLSWRGYFSGLIEWTAGAGLVFWAAASLYNRFTTGRVKEISTEREFATRQRVLQMAGKPGKYVYPFHEESSGYVDAAPERVFAILDDHARLAAHMAKPSWRMGWASVWLLHGQVGLQPRRAVRYLRANKPPTA